MNRRVLIFVTLIALLFTFAPLLQTTVRADCPETSPAATAEVTGVKGAITADSIHVRSEASASSEDLGIVRRNDVVMVLGRNNESTWAQITTSAGVTGWIGSPYVVLLNNGKLNDLPVVGAAGSESAAATEEATAPAGEATAAATEEATPCPPTPTNGTGGAETPAANATEATTDGGNATAGLKGAITADSIRVRSEPSQTSQDLGIVRRNDVVMVIGRNSGGTWAKITTSAGVTGWVGSAYVVMLQGKYTDLPVVN